MKEIYNILIMSQIAILNFIIYTPSTPDIFSIHKYRNNINGEYKYTASANKHKYVL